ncbi:MAG: SRPBCC family protein [Prevotella sp.]|nr:SRPBCC family protein [Prevotella sp.]MCF0208865.1 SRPBCC family protein [Bacteroidaceae bacterium]
MEVTSSIKEMSFPQQMVYDVLSNPSRLEKLKDFIPADQKEKAEAIKFTESGIEIEAPGVGSVALNIVEREEPKTIKFEAGASMMTGNLWIQLLPTSLASSKMKLTIKLDVPFFMKAMIKKPLEEGVEKIADTLAMIKYDIF